MAEIKREDGTTIRLKYEDGRVLAASWRSYFSTWSLFQDGVIFRVPQAHENIYPFGRIIAWAPMDGAWEKIT